MDALWRALAGRLASEEIERRIFCNARDRVEWKSEGVEGGQVCGYICLREDGEAERWTSIEKWMRCWASQIQKKLGTPV